MDAPRTATGSPCKLCLKKGPGGRCHLHGGTPKTPSPKKQSPRKSPRSTKTSPKLPTSFERFAGLPDPALYQVLLNLSPKDLKNLTEISKRSHRTRTVHRFGPEYDVKRKTDPFTLGKKTRRKGGEFSTFNEVVITKNGVSIKILSWGKVVQIFLSSQTLYPVLVTFDRSDTETIFSMRSNPGDRALFAWVLEDHRWNISKDSKKIQKPTGNIIDTFNEIVLQKGKPEWVISEDSNGYPLLPQNMPRELFRSVVGVLGKDSVNFDI
jgi:hypothetical protein